MKKEELAEKMARMSARPEAIAPMPDEDFEIPRQRPIRSKPVQLTVTVSPTMYRQLKAFPDRAGILETTGKISIPTVEIMRALVDELMADAALQRKVARRIIRDNI